MRNATLLLSALCIAGMIGPAHAAGDAAAGKAKADASCAGCHGPKGEGSPPNPKIAGMKEEAFIKAVNDYKSGAKPQPVKKMLMAPLTDQEIADLAAYYAGQ